MIRRLTLRILALLVGLILVEFALVLAIRDGTIFGRPLPPYGAVNNARQAEWLDRLRSDEPFQLARFDAELGWEWVPGAVSETGDVHLNAQGARGTREYAARPPTGVVRCAFFGDSFVFCDEMDDASTFEHYLEDRRSELEALNFGVNGYGTDQALLRFRRRGRDLGAHVVWIGVLAENIGRNANRFRPFWNPRSGFAFPKPRFVLENDELVLLPQPFADRAELARAFDDGSIVRLLSYRDHWADCPDLGALGWSRSARLAGLPLAHHARNPLRLWGDAAGEPRRVTLALLAAFQAEALAAGAERAPVLLFPSREDLLEAQASGGERWAHIPSALAAASIEFVDLMEPLLERQELLERDPTLGTLHYGGHHSTIGNDVVARTIERWLVDQRILTPVDRGASTNDR
ncbi:MAG: hypothetical protein WD226_08895 [Planctomycetota bacterium]